jgi:hypothetical protein
MNSFLIPTILPPRSPGSVPSALGGTMGRGKGLSDRSRCAASFLFPTLIHPAIHFLSHEMSGGFRPVLGSSGVSPELRSGIVDGHVARRQSPAPALDPSGKPFGLEGMSWALIHGHASERKRSLK